MPNFGAEVAIVQNGRILLTKREDFEVWCMPGGAVDSGESFGQAAIREAWEETGLHVRLTRLVGSYTRPNWADGLFHIHLFAAEVAGGEMRLKAGETLDMGYFLFTDLPGDLLFGHRQRIQDVADGLTGAVKTEQSDWPFPGLDRWALYRRHFPDLTPEQIVTEVAGVRTQ